jgi:hypothetical protein
MANRLPEGLKDSEKTISKSIKVFVLFQAIVSHNFTVPSSDPVARRLPEGLKTTE